MSAKGYCYDNAWAEAFIGSLKGEMLQGGGFESAADARGEVSDYLEGGYNTHRQRSALDYLTPSRFETRIHALNQAPNWSGNRFLCGLLPSAPPGLAAAGALRIR